MDHMSALSCEHIYMERIPGKTDRALTALQDYLRALFSPSHNSESAEVIITCDGETRCFEWFGSSEALNPTEALSPLGNAIHIDIRINLCCDHFTLIEEQRELYDILRDGSLKDCVHCRTLLEDEDSTSLTMSGLHCGAFLHGNVPFCANAVSLQTAWNGYTHRAVFSFAPADFDHAQDLTDVLEDRLDIELSAQNDEIRIENVHLENADDIAFYRETLEKLSALAQDAQISGALTPESDDVFALLRFVLKNDSVAIETAIAEVHA